jgi:4,5-dihydroxyphthalate decarboxylase
MRSLTAALRRYPHTEPLLDGTIAVDGCRVDFPGIDPIHEAFAPMAREQRYDISELAVATLLQAFEAGVPVAALPVIMLGNFPHRALYAWGAGPRVDPGDLRGRRVGVRAYSQTTGLWARGVLSDTYGVSSRDVTWVTTEGAHVATAQDPLGVERTSGNLVDALRSGGLASIVLGAPFAAKVDGLVPLIPDWKARQESFLEERGWVPANHLVVVRRDLLQSDSGLVRAVYRALAAGIDAARPAEPTGSIRERVVQYGVNDTLLAMLCTAIRYAREQGVIQRDLDPAELFADFEKYAGGS